MEVLMTDVTDSGIVTTATDLLITGGREGYLQVLNARSGELLWKTNLGAQMLSSPMTYAVNGRQYRDDGQAVALYIRAAGITVMSCSAWPPFIES